MSLQDALLPEALHDNPLINPPPMPHGAPALHLIKPEHILPAIRYAIAEETARIEAIKANPSTPDFQNTIEALESAGMESSRIRDVFEEICLANTNDSVREIQEIGAAELARHDTAKVLDPEIFARISSVYDRRDSLNLAEDQKLLLTAYYKDFVRSGALLHKDQKDRLKTINEEIARLETQFSQRLILETKAYQKTINDEAILDGVPERAKDLYRQAAKEAEIPEPFLILLSPFPTDILTHATNRALREEILKARRARCCQGNENDTRNLILDLVRLRHEQANLLGFSTYAAYALDDTMAGDPETVSRFLERNLATYKTAAKKELEELRVIAKERDGIEDIQPWDLAYYSRILKEERFDFDLEEARPFFELNNVANGVLRHNEKLFGIRFEEERTGKYPVYDPAIKVFEVYDQKTGGFLGLLYADFFARPGEKEDGAWMNNFRLKSNLNDKTLPPLIKVGFNFPEATSENPTLLSFEETKTIAHELGHALHGLLSKTRFPSQAGPIVSLDFVELPSQLQENWVTESETLQTFARHYQTGEPLSLEMLEKIKSMETFHAGLTGLRQTHFALLDMAFHGIDPNEIESVQDLEKIIEAKALLLPSASGSIAASFNHIFGGGYSAGYYSYKWAEVLEADIFGFFKEKGLYDPKLSVRLRDTIYSKGSSRKEMDLFVDFAGRAPDPDALFKREGLSLPSVPGKATPSAVLTRNEL